MIRLGSGPASVASAVAEPLGEADCEVLGGGLVNQPTNTASSLAYLVVGIWLLSRLGRIDRGDRLWAGLYAAMVALNGLGSVAYHGPQFTGASYLHDLPVVGVLLIGALVPTVRRFKREVAVPGLTRTILGFGVAFALAAGVGYFFGRTGSPLCEPTSYAQPHGLWHLATAALMGLWALAVWPSPASSMEQM